MLIESIISAILVGWARGGRIKRLADFQLSFSWLIIAAFLLQGILPWLASGEFAKYRFYVLTASYVMIFWALIKNKFNWGITLAATGVFLNFLVIAVNGGMPVSGEAARVAGYKGGLSGLATVKDGVHVLLGQSTRLSWLADIIPQPLPSPLGGVISPGDILMAAGVFLIIQSQMIYVGRRRKSGETGNRDK